MSVYDQNRSWSIQISRFTGDGGMTKWVDVDHGSCPLTSQEVVKHRLSTKSLTINEAMEQLHNLNVIDQDPEHILGVSPSTGRQTDYSYRAYNAELKMYFQEVFQKGPQNRFTLCYEGVPSYRYPSFGYGTLAPELMR